MDSADGSVAAGIHIHRYSSGGEIKDITAINTVQLGFDQVTQYIQTEDFGDDILILFTSRSVIL